MIDNGLEITLVGLRQVDKQPVLVYTIEGQQKQVDMEKLIAAVSRRINPSGVAEVTVRRYGNRAIGSDCARGRATRSRPDQTHHQHQRQSCSSASWPTITITSDIVDLAEQSTADDVYQGGKLKARWIEMLPGAHTQGAITRNRNGVEQVLIMIDNYNVNGDYLAGASREPDPTTGNLCIAFSFNSAGANKFSHLTGENVPDPATGAERSLGIVLDNVLQSAADDP